MGEETEENQAAQAPATQPKNEGDHTPETVPYARFSEKVAEYKATKKELLAVTERVKTLEAAIAEKEGEAGKLLAQYQREAEAAKGELLKIRTDAALKDALLHAGATPQTLAHAATLARTGVEVDERGAITGVEESVAKLKAEVPALFGGKAPTGHASGPATEADKATELKAQYEAAKKRGDVVAMSAALTQLTALK